MKADSEELERGLMLQNDWVIKWQRKSNVDKCKAVHKGEK